MKKYKLLQTIGWLFITIQFVKYFNFDLNTFRTSLSPTYIDNGFSNGYGFAKIVFFNIHLFVGIILITISNKKIKELQSEIQ